MQCVEVAKGKEEDVDGSTLFYFTLEGEEPPLGDSSTGQSSNSGTNGVDEADRQENADCNQTTEKVNSYHEIILSEVEIEIEAQQTSNGLSA